MRRLLAPCVLACAFLVLGAPFVTGCGAKEEAQAAPVTWGSSIDEGLTKAKAESKMVLVDFTAVW